MKFQIALIVAIGLAMVASAPIDLSDKDASKQVAVVSDSTQEADAQKKDQAPEQPPQPQQPEEGTYHSTLFNINA